MYLYEQVPNMRKDITVDSTPCDTFAKKKIELRNITMSLYNVLDMV